MLLSSKVLQFRYTTLSSSKLGLGILRSHCTRVRPCHVCDNLETCARKRGDRCIVVVVVVGQRSQNTRSALELHVELKLGLRRAKPGMPVTSARHYG